MIEMSKNSVRTLEQIDPLLRSSEERIHTMICNGNLDCVISGIQATSGCSHGAKIHLEGDVAKHTAKVVATLASISSEDSALQFDTIDLLAALMHDAEKVSTRVEDAEGNVSFPGHEEKAANRVPEVARKLWLSSEQQAKLDFLVREHGVAHSLPSEDAAVQGRIVNSPYWRNLRLLQKADALSCFLTPDGSTRLPVHWDLFDELCSRSK